MKEAIKGSITTAPCQPSKHAQVALMKEALKDKVIGGQRWRLGSKKREDLVRDYRWVGGWAGGWVGRWVLTVGGLCSRVRSAAGWLANRQLRRVVDPGASAAQTKTTAPSCTPG